MFRGALASILSLGLCFSALTSTNVLAETNEIVGGSEVTPGQYPFMAAILDSSGSPTSQYCGGSLISSGWVASAAHCFVENGSVTPANQVRVGMGLHRLSSGGGTTFSVKRVIVHPSYNANTNDNDIALLELNGSASQTPITVQTGNADLTGLTATAIGWGLTDPNNNNSSSDVLRSVNLPIISNSACNSSFGGGITSNMVCAGFAQGGKDTCQGDSGGPLVTTIGGVLTLVGITSFGNGCAEPNSYGVYSRPSQFQSFIEQYVPLSPPPIPTDGKLGLWNGYLNMTNIIELVNNTGSSVYAQVNMHSIDGTLVSSNFYTIPANSQQDVILNGLRGFQADSYGLVQVSSNIQGRIFYYRPTGPIFSDFEYVFGVSLESPKTGKSFVGFNTYQPSFNYGDAANLVANWLSVVNLSATARSFVISKYDASGSLLSSQTVSVNAKSRADFDGGHISPGPSNVGLIEVAPTDPSTQYLSQLMRYGYGANGSFDFAFPLRTGAGSTSTITVALGSSFFAQNWLEVLNVGSSSNTVLVSFYNAAGTLVNQQSVTLGARSQQHINVNAILGNQTLGYARLATQSGQPVVAESMFYFRNSISGSITAMYGLQADVAQTGQHRGSFNLFLGMEDYLRLSNPSDSSINVDVTITSAFSAGSSRTVTLPANSTQELSLHDTATYGTTADSYGVVTVNPQSPSSPALHEVIRAKQSGGELQFAAPTELDIN
ncbi:MAG: serine protease [Bdellovibrionota bacterium]